MKSLSKRAKKPYKSTLNFVPAKPARLDDGGELGGAIGAHQFAQRHQARRDDAVEGSLYLGVAEVERGLRGIDLRLLQCRLRAGLGGPRLLELELVRSRLWRYTRSHRVTRSLPEVPHLRGFLYCVILW